MDLNSSSYNARPRPFFLACAVALFVLWSSTNCGKVEDKLALFNPVFGSDELPKVVSSNPVPGQEGVGTDATITVLFNKTVRTQECTQAFRIQPSALGFFQVAGPVLTFKPSAPLSAGTHVFTISKECEDMDGRDIDPVYTASFAVGTAASVGAPTVQTITVPAGTTVACAAGTGTVTDVLASSVTTGCTGNPSVSPIVVTFSEPMNRATVEGAFVITPSTGGAFTWSADSTTVTFTPDTTLTFGARYEVNISTSAEDATRTRMNFAVRGSFVVGTLDNTAPTVTSVDLEQIQPPSADACVAPANDQILAAGGNAVSVCVNIPIIVNFSEDMAQAVTASAISFSPSVSANMAWTATNQLTITPLGTLSGNTLYTFTISTGAADLAGNRLVTPFGVTFRTENSPRVSAVGLESHGAGCDAFGDVGGNGGFGAGNCWWDDSLAIGAATGYLISGGNTAGCTDTTTDNIRIIFSTPMEPASTLGAVSVRRISPPTTSILIGRAIWTDANRVLTISPAEDLAACNGTSLFGLAGDFDLNETASGGVGFPIYTLEVDTTAKDANGTNLPSLFTFSFEGG